MTDAPAEAKVAADAESDRAAREEALRTKMKGILEESSSNGKLKAALDTVISPAADEEAKKPVEEATAATDAAS